MLWFMDNEHIHVHVFLTQRHRPASPLYSPLQLELPFSLSKYMTAKGSIGGVLKGLSALVSQLVASWRPYPPKNITSGGWGGGRG